MREPMSCHVMMSSTANTASGSLRASRTSGGGGVGLLSAGDGRRAASRSRQPQRLVALGAGPSKGRRVLGRLLCHAFGSDGASKQYL